MMLATTMQRARHRGRTLALVLCLLLGLAGAACAQDGAAYVEQVAPDVTVATSAEAALDRADALALIESRLGPMGRSLLREHGASDGHLALARQHGAANHLALDQTGRGHLATLDQWGDGNHTTLLQAGDGNLVGAWLQGDGLTLRIAQAGTDNLYLLDGEGYAPGHAATVLQHGDRNQAVQLGTGVVPFSIEQIGNDLHLIIRHHGAQ